MPVMINPLVVFLTCSVHLMIMGSECVGGFGEGSNYQLVTCTRPQQEEQIVPIETSLDFEVAHLSELMV